MESLFYNSKTDTYTPWNEAIKEKKKEIFDCMQNRALTAISHKTADECENENSTTAV